MRISDWSSDVCSSDLPAGGGGSEAARRAGGRARLEMAVHLSRTGRRDGERAGAAGEPAGPFPHLFLIGDEQLLRARARGTDLRDAGYGNQAARSVRRSRRRTEERWRGEGCVRAGRLRGGPGDQKKTRIMRKE